MLNNLKETNKGKFIKNAQNGFISDITFAGWVVIIIAICLIGSISIGAYQMTDANADLLKEVNATVELAKKQPFSKEFNTAIKPYLEDGRITNEEAKIILKEYETIKLKYNISASEFSSKK
ncbi:TPA: hypothetical protein ACIFEI_003607 [Acinetobacter nosocomialis]